MTVDESLRELLQNIDKLVCDSISAMDRALDAGSERELAKAAATYEAYKATYDHFCNLFPNVTY